jgi:hypothetical protein
MVTLNLYDVQVLGFLAAVFCLKHKLTVLCGGGVVPEVESFLAVLCEKGTFDYEVGDLENIRVEIWSALRLSQPKQAQVRSWLLFFEVQLPPYVTRRSLCVFIIV